VKAVRRAWGEGHGERLALPIESPIATTVDSENSACGSKVSSKARSVVLIVAGFAMLALAAVGVAIPVLPTTPFVLVAAGCFSVASPRLYGWLARNRVFGPYISNYRTGGGVSIAHKVGGVIFLWAGLAVGAFHANSWWIRGLLVAVGVGVTIHLLTIKTRRIGGGAPQATNPLVESLDPAIR
jgi:uncharacterized membrane protein YbaN (DUF454 family)